MSVTRWLVSTSLHVNLSGFILSILKQLVNLSEMFMMFNSFSANVSFETLVLPLPLKSLDFTSVIQVLPNAEHISDLIVLVTVFSSFKNNKEEARDSRIPIVSTKSIYSYSDDVFNVSIDYRIPYNNLFLKLNPS